MSSGLHPYAEPSGLLWNNLYSVVTPDSAYKQHIIHSTSDLHTTQHTYGD